MNPLQELATQALLGTERRPPLLPPPAGALGDLLEAACPPDTEIEVRMLRAAGAMAVCADAGFVPAAAGDGLPEPCPPELGPGVADAVLVSALGRVLDEGPTPLQGEALRLLAARGLLLPPSLLPSALALGRTTPALRAALSPVLGRRGGWLARCNPAWSYVGEVDDAAPDMALWDHGTPEQRRQLLGRLRATDPNRARGLLREGLPQLDARERAGLLEQLAIGLGPADEDLLEALLADRGKEVRQLAARLLAQLPASRFGARMAARVAACLRLERKLLRQVLVLEPPQRFDADWKADALEEGRAKSESLGERAWWLYQLARALPLAWWTGQTGMAPADLTRWAREGDWGEALFRAWGEALARRPDAAWATAFLAHAPRDGLALDAYALIGCLPPSQREPYWLQMLEAGPRARGELLGHIVQALAPGDAELSAEFAGRVLREVRGSLPSDAGKWDYTLRKTLPEFVCLIPPACFPEATQGWPPGRPETEYFNDTLARVLAIVEQRTTLQRFLRERKPS